MMLTEENKPNTPEEYSIYRYKTVIEEEILEEDAKLIEHKGVDVNLVLEF